MYSHTLRIAVFSSNPVLAEEIRAFVPQECFTHDILVLDKFDAETLGWAEVAILDVPLPGSLPEIRAQARSGARLIACMEPEAEENLTDMDLASVDDVWLKPVLVPRIRLRMRNLLSEIKRDADATQHMLWLDTLIDSMPDLVWFKDLAGIHHKVNSRFCEFVGKERDEVIGATHSRIWNTPDDDDSCKASEQAAIEAGGTVLADEIVKSGIEKHLFKTYKTPLKGPHGEILGTVGFGHDLTNLLNLDMELNFFVDSMPFPLAICREDGAIRKVNNVFLEFFGEKRDRIVGQSFADWCDNTFQGEISPVNGCEYLRFEKNDKMHFVDLVRKRIRDIFGKSVGEVNIFRDITAEKDLEIRIWRDANTDSLTGLANRSALDSFVKKLPASAVIHLFYIDLDEFKAVNDLWGHKAGDEALKIVAKSIRNVFAQDFPARLGGDEFLVCVQREVPFAELERLGSTLLRRINQKFSGSNQLSRMSASIGIRGYGTLGTSIDPLIRQADIAMYAAKSMGKGRYCIWNEAMGEK